MYKFNCRRWPAVGVAFVCLWLTACGGDGSTGVAAAAPATVSCGQLVNRKIDASQIGLPTGGAVVVSATQVAASATGVDIYPEHCLVEGTISPVDSSAPSIDFSVALPTAWNTKAVMLGGSGFDGTVPDVEGNGALPGQAASSPLARGYAVFASDSGHQSTAVVPATDGAFMTNAEAYQNWAGDALKKTRDVALSLVTAVYGQAPTKSYFLGSSSGGKEALLSAGRWPADWDGIVSFFPARNTMSLGLGLLNSAQALAQPGAYPSAAKRAVLRQAALDACDGLDGVKDGVISDVQQCNAIFDPVAATANGAPLRCPGGQDTGDSCLSDTQIAAIRTLNSTLEFDISLASGDTSYPGYNAFISDLGAASASPVQSTVALFTLGAVPPSAPTTPADALPVQLIDNFIRYAIVGDPGFDFLSLDAGGRSAYASRFSYLSTLDIGDRDLSAFAAHGGKALLLQGTEDMLLPPRSTEFYFQRLQATMGGSTVAAFMRFYEVPGYGHGIGGAFTPSWDALSALEGWVEQGADPATDQVVTDLTGVPGRTRPLCLFPTFPRYAGSGDVNSASSFTCASK